MKHIPLTKGQVALVDDEDFDRLNAHKWRSLLDRHTNSYYAVRWSPIVDGKRHLILMHREIMGAKDGEEVDHINNVPVDNQRANLRLCAHSQNLSNRRMFSTNKSGYKGVSWNRQNEKWRAVVSINGKQKHLGYFATAPEAALAYDLGAVEYHRAFARTNDTLGLLSPS